jgi:DNA-binding HxlR family transcriptional regulator
MSDIKKHGEINAAAKMIADWRSMMIVHAIYEHGPVRYKDLDSMLALSPTILSGKLSQLTEAGIISRVRADGAKEVIYKTLPVAAHMVEAYHLLETVNDKLKDK